MWPFSKPDTLEESGMFKGMTDWHSHILPGVDDGIRTLDDSLAVLEQYDRWGIKEVWLTPHIMEDYPNTPEHLREVFGELSAAWKGNVKLNLAAEHMMDALFEERLSKGEVMPLGKNGEYLLVETSYFNPPMNMDEILEDVKRAGYFPVLAHPERYRYMSEKDYVKLRDNDIRFQVNFNSLVGGYGETAKKKGEWLLRKGWVEAVGSDVHRLSSLQNLAARHPSKKAFVENLVGIASNPKIG